MLGRNPLLGIKLLFIREHFDRSRQQKCEHSRRISDPVNVRYDCDSLPRPQVRESKFGVILYRAGGETLEICGELIEHSYPLVLLKRRINCRNEDCFIVFRIDLTWSADANYVSRKIG